MKKKKENPTPSLGAIQSGSRIPSTYFVFFLNRAPYCGQFPIPKVKCILVFNCLNNLVPKYLVQVLTGNQAFFNHATRRSNDLHPRKPKHKRPDLRFKYEYEIEYENDFSILVYRLHIIKSHAHFIP